MALADKRPLGVPVTSHASAYPLKSTIPDLKGVETAPQESLQDSDSLEIDGDLLPTSRLILPDLLMQQKKLLTLLFSSRDSTPQPFGSGAYKKVKVPSRVPIATGILTTIPVTGEKPKPVQEGDASLEDDVLFAIFLILYEKDPVGAGMTVKQICDVLVERHPEMAQLLLKTSNLVLAKLNAYVKRVEKGDSNLRYALSREWADASPKRMVYVYRGLLAKNFHVNLPNPGTQPAVVKPVVLETLESAKNHALLKPRRSTMYDLGVTRPAFVESPIDRSNLFVPYALAPVAASLAEKADAVASEETAKNDPASELAPKTDDLDFDDLEVFNDDDDDADVDDFLPVKHVKRSKSMSSLTLNKKAKFLTAAAAAPRAPKAPCSPSPNAAAAAAALHAAALKAIAAANSTSSSLASSLASSSGTSPALLATPEATASPKAKDWQHAVRLGFLSQEIGAPEDLSLSDLDKLFS